MADFDIEIAGYKARVKRDDEAATFRPFFMRQSLGQQELGGGAFKTNTTRRAQVQTGWQGGSTWWQPMLRGAGEESSYFMSRGLNAYEKPGYIFPLPFYFQTTVTALPATGSPMVPVGDILYFMSDTDSGGNKLLAKLEDGTYSTIAGATAGSSTLYYGMTYKKETQYFYVLSATHMSRVKADGTENNDWIVFGTMVGSCVFVTPYGTVWAYGGGSARVLQVDETTGALTVITNDGLGGDFLNSIAEPANPILWKNQPNLAVSTSEGFYYIKNAAAGGVVQPWLFRVERDESGNINSVPIGNLPPGTVALSITSFLDSIIISYSSDIARVLKNDQADPYVTGLYHFSGGNKGVIGLFIGEAPDESPSQFLGSDEKYLYVGGHKRVWVYDGVRGGTHPILEITTVVDGSFSGYSSNTVNSGGKPVIAFYVGDREFGQDIDRDTDEVTAFGDDLTTHRLQSNPFDFGVPFELKTLSRVHVNTEALAATQQYTIRVRADGGSWTTVAAHTNAKVATYNIVALGISGYVFEYELIWEAKAGGQTYPSPALRDVMFEANVGSNQAGFEFTLDGSEILNVENQVIDVAAFFDNMMTLGATETPVAFIHRMSGHVEQQETNTFTVYIQELEFLKGGANEGDVKLTVVLA